MNIDELGSAILNRRIGLKDSRCLLVGISGIDASGKGYIANRLANELQSTGQNVALINIDGWLNLPNVRFSEADPGRHFYRHALRLDEAFDQLILPLKLDREIDITMDFAEETAHKFRPYRYHFHNIDIILLEGIFLFKGAYVRHFDMKVWIECSFETALSRAIVRNQEGLSPSETIQAYETIYFPAQQHRIKIDRPFSTADLIISNELIWGFRRWCFPVFNHVRQKRRQDPRKS
jgi:uridine kinase